MHRTIDRRRFLTGALAGLGGYALMASPMARAFTMSKRQLHAAGVGGDGRPRIYTIVLDGLRPDEITPEMMPNLVALREAGASYATASSLMVAETLPNHVAMMTGHTPASSGVPANDIYDHELGEDRKASRPDDIAVETVLARLRSAGLSTATVMSKVYLVDVFQGAADHHWTDQPFFIPVSEHVPDHFTFEEAQRVVDDLDPDFMFVNAGDIDRSGHSDFTGPYADARAFRRSVIAQTDQLLGEFVGFLQDSGRWDASTLMITADHSMDWSTPFNFIQLAAAYDDDPLLAGNHAVVDNGGADLVYWLGEDAQRAEAAERMIHIAGEVEGVESVLSTGRAGISRKAGDVVAFAEPGWRFSDPDEHSNPIPGNHGHKVTLPIPMIVSGGVEFVQEAETVEGTTAHTMDIAPTVAWLFGVDGAETMSGAASRYEGQVLAEAFGDLGRTVEDETAGDPVDDDTAPVGDSGVAGAQEETGDPLPATGGLDTLGAGLGVAAGAHALRRLRDRIDTVSQSR